MTILRCINDEADHDYRWCMAGYPVKGELYTVRGKGHIIWETSGGVLTVQYGFLLEEIKNNPCPCIGNSEPAFYTWRFQELRDIKKVLEPPAIELDDERRRIWELI